MSNKKNMSMKMFRLLLVIFFAPSILSLYQNSKEVNIINRENFEEKVIDTNYIWVVKFYAEWCNHCKKFVSEYEKTAQAFKSIVKFGAIDGDKNALLSNRYRVDEYPSVFIFGHKKENPYRFKSKNHTAEALSEFILKTIKEQVEDGLKPKLVASRYVKELKDEDFQSKVMGSFHGWIVFFYKSSNKNTKKIGNVLATCGKELKGKIKIGCMKTKDNETPNVLGVKEGIRVFPFGIKRKGNFIDYDSKITVDVIVDWVSEQYEEYMKKPQVYQIINEEVLRETCEDKPKCIVSFLPKLSMCAKNCRNDYLNLLKAMYSKFKEKLWGWVWSEEGAQNEIEDILYVNESGYPSIFAVDIKNMVYSVLSGTITEENVDNFLLKVIDGKSENFTINARSYPIIREVEIWDDEGEEEKTEEKDEL